MKKQYIIFPCILFLTSILGCASQSDHTAPNSLECILEAFVSSVDGVEAILISEHSGWTEESSLIRVLSINDDYLTGGKIVHSTYNELDVYYEYGFLSGDSIVYNNDIRLFSIPNDLRWKLIDIHKGKENMFPEMLDFEELQIEYDIKKKCIIDIVLGSKTLKSKLKSCKYCHN